MNNAEAVSMGILPFEILSSLFRVSPWNTDEGRLVRTTSVDLGIPQLLLRCLAAFSHQNERRSTPVEEKQEVRFFLLRNILDFRNLKIGSHFF